MSVIDEVKQKADIIEVVSQYATLTKAGRNFRALCPFHSETRPSFMVYPEQQSWHCFGACSTGGDVFSFIMKKENIDFGEALRLLAERVGVIIPSRSEPATSQDKKDRLFQANKLAADHFLNLLLGDKTAAKARQYLESRAISAETIKDFRLGYSPNKWDSLKQHLMKMGYSEDELLEAGLIIRSDDGQTHDRFRNRLMFPISDSRERVIGFGARALDDSLPKYLNSPQTPLFDKSGSIYGINRATAIRQQDKVVIVEGYMDVITAHQNDFTNVVAAMGTAVTERQLLILKRLTRNIIFAMDADSAGEEATRRSGEIAVQPSKEDLEDNSKNNTEMKPLDEGKIRRGRIFGSEYVDQNILDTDVKILVLPSGKDPDDIIKEDTKIWQNMVKEAKPVFDYIFDTVTAKLDLTTAKDKSVALDNLLPIIAKISDSVHHAHYQQKLSRLVQLNTRILSDLETSLSKTKTNSKTENPKSIEVARKLRSTFSSPLEEDCLSLLLNYPELKEQGKNLLPAYFENQENREIFLAWRQTDDLTALKQKLDTTIHEYLEALNSKSLPGMDIEGRYDDYARRLSEKFFRNLEARRAEKFALEAESRGSGADLAILEAEGTEPANQLREIYHSRARKVRR